MPSIFTRIITGEIPSYKVAENENFFAFLDIQPLALGHTLVVPKKEVDYIFDVEDELYHQMWAFAKKVGEAVRAVVPCKRIGIAVIGLEVPHAHIHLIPLNSMDDINFSREKLKLTPQEFAETAEKISAAFHG